jgi:hypothetical protein
MEKPVRVWSKGRKLLVRLKGGVDQAAYFAKHPDCVAVTDGRPNQEELEEMVSDGIARAICGCDGLETDGWCDEHDMPSWLVALGLI